MTARKQTPRHRKAAKRIDCDRVYGNLIQTISNNKNFSLSDRDKYQPYPGQGAAAHHGFGEKWV